MKRFLLPLALMSALLVSCEKQKQEYTISVFPTELTFGAKGGEQTVKVTANTSWYINGLPHWCEYYSDGDEVTIHVWPIDANNFTGREGIMTFYAHQEAAIAELKVVQEGDSIIQFKDPLFLQAILAVSGADDNDDGQISILEASSFNPLFGLSCGGDGIRVMDEIKYFTALTELYCDDNQLTSLDLSDCTALTELSCGYNQLTSLDLSNNTALEYLSCKSNDLTTLDVSNCADLTALYCYDNQLTSLDVSNCADLTELSCDDNQLTSLDVSGCTALTHLYCGDNQLTSLDLSGCTALTWLVCSGNQLSRIILHRNHIIYNIEDIIEEYGDIIIYVE